MMNIKNKTLHDAIIIFRLLSNYLLKFTNHLLINYSQSYWQDKKFQVSE